MTKFGFLGLGIMGSAMAANLVRAGFEVVVWNRNPEKCAPLVALGARQADSPRQVVEQCGVTFAMLADPAAAEAVCFAGGGVLEGLPPGHGYVDMSTVDAETSQKIGAAVLARGGRFLEAPVSGSKKPAEEGTLLILAAGDAGLFEEARPALDKMGKQSFYLGELGNGAQMKLVVNMVMGGMMAIFAEALALAEKGGLDPRQLLEVLAGGALANPMFKGKGSAMLAGDFTVNFPLKHMQKDLRLALRLGDEVAQPLFAAATANEAFKKARSLGLGEEDFSALFRAVKAD
ncbi:3-hydroxyisobutyrate dehydrogenase [Desulfuromonas versatilis]|uniref:3-hydroxyisobutyrate dehydrogenase n=1 Tax=Desulfuromonas versatilis TaxID=2802975 RepID=A0ABN6E407_9BACT|nr:NAD(P)-dependent oxidoreductase [Desulfuromonas versatilis]BCR06952.1 3-hydroxyisobutyrate dehydrogenase [Desulfuromonas versatilis]